MEKTVSKAFQVLELLVKTGRPCGVTEIADATGLLKSNVHRLLGTLTALGYARQVEETNRYEPSLRLWELGQQIYAGISIVQAARPHLRRLVELTDETAHLAALEGIEVVYLDKIESPNPVRAYTAVGGRGPAHCTASGKALIAQQTSASVAALAGSLTAFTANTIVDIAKLQTELALVRRRGFASALGEFRANVASVAAPVRNGEGTTIAAVGIAGPLDRMRPRKVKELAPVVMDAAAAISEALGASVPQLREPSTYPMRMANLQRISDQ